MGEICIGYTGRKMDGRRWTENPEIFGQVSVQFSVLVRLFWDWWQKTKLWNWKLDWSCSIFQFPPTYFTSCVANPLHRPAAQRRRWISTVMKGESFLLLIRWWCDVWKLRCVPLGPQSSYSVVFLAVLSVLRCDATHQGVSWKIERNGGGSLSCHFEDSLSLKLSG